MFLLLAGYLLARAALGALVNPPFNGPDEGGHWEYVETWTAGGSGAVTGVEHAQPPAYYALASLPFRWSAGAPLRERLFEVRLLSVLAGVVTATATWLAARRLWPGRPFLALAAAGVAALAPGHLFLLASVNNDPLATALASIAVLAAIYLWLAPTAPFWVLWAVASALAVGTKYSTAPVVLGTALALLWRYRARVRRRLGKGVVYGLAGAGAVLAVGVYLRLLGQPPSTSRWASLAHFWPVTLLQSLPAYVRGGLAESFGTFWYAYDYGVRWPVGVGSALAATGAALVLGAGAGLALRATGSRGKTWRSRKVPDVGCRATDAGAPLVLWLAAGTQIALVVLRFGFGSVLQIEMGGAAQAKGFFPALLPLALLFVWGWAALYRFAGGRDDRWLTLALLGTFLLLDWASLGATLWHHYRWLQIGLSSSLP